MRRDPEDAEPRGVQPPLATGGPAKGPEAARGNANWRGGTAPSRQESKRGGCGPGRQTRERGPAVSWGEGKTGRAERGVEKGAGP